METPVKEDPKVTEALAELHKRMAGKTATEQVQMLADFSARHFGTKKEETQTPVFLTEDQFQRMLTGVDEAKKVAEEAAATAERKYHIPAGEAKAIAVDKISSELTRSQHRHEDFKQMANVFRSMALVSTGRANASVLDAAREQEKEHMVRTGREVRNIDVGTGSEGGFLAPELWNTMLYENLARVSLLRKYAYWFQMDNQIMRLPKITANLTANTVAELSSGTGSQPTFAQATWNLKKLTVLTNPFSIEALEHARPELVQMLLNVATVEMNRKMDEVCFNTTDSAWTDLLDTTVNRYYLGGSSTSGKTLDTTVTFDDMAGLLFQLAEQYVPDEDVQGSGIVGGGEAQYFVNKSLIQNLLKIKGTTSEYIWGKVTELQSGRKIFGKNVRRVISLPSSATAATQFAVFGNLQYRWVGYRPGFIIDLLREGIVNGVNLAQTSAYALRINQLMDIATIDDNAFSRLSTAVS